ncbi:putative flap endonuclease-1-like 5' DNA nuclease [Sagittula marina]|uniref:Putative flap endonuclease-1-like 5' DNA nuclease n=2 Tax=Sagittula marina TaxID=943940 RepID=A0A7W6GUI4_9RHOB|nr:putative flap endonuclease-1-like 5' DNA nuclease [Sagittula marina]
MMISPMISFKPDYSPVIKMMEMQTKLVIETSQAMMELAMLPWQGLPMAQMPKMTEMPFATTGFGSICNPTGKAKMPEVVAPVAHKTTEAVADSSKEIAEVAAVAIDESVETAADAAEDVTETMSATVAETTEVAAESAADVADNTVATVDESTESMLGVAPDLFDAPKGEMDDLTVITGVGPKLAETLNAAGIYHLSQIAAWSEDNVTWIDANIAGVRGRASKNGWVAQASELLK